MRIVIREGFVDLENEELGLDIRVSPKYVVLFQRIGSIVLRLIIVGGEVCYDIKYRFNDPETGNDAYLVLDGARYPCSCDPAENVVMCLNYGECCEYVPGDRHG